MHSSTVFLALVATLVASTSGLAIAPRGQLTELNLLNNRALPSSSDALVEARDPKHHHKAKVPAVKAAMADAAPKDNFLARTPPIKRDDDAESIDDDADDDDEDSTTMEKRSHRGRKGRKHHHRTSKHYRVNQYRTAQQSDTLGLSALIDSPLGEVDSVLSVGGLGLGLGNNRNGRGGGGLLGGSGGGGLGLGGLTDLGGLGLGGLGLKASVHPHLTRFNSSDSLSTSQLIALSFSILSPTRSSPSSTSTLSPTCRAISSPGWFQRHSRRFYLFPLVNSRVSPIHPHDGEKETASLASSSAPIERGH